MTATTVTLKDLRAACFVGEAIPATVGDFRGKMDGIGLSTAVTLIPGPAHVLSVELQCVGEVWQVRVTAATPTRLFRVVLDFAAVHSDGADGAGALSLVRSENSVRNMPSIIQVCVVPVTATKIEVDLREDVLCISLSAEAAGRIGHALRTVAAG